MAVEGEMPDNCLWGTGAKGGIVNAIERLISEACEEGMVTEVIRPAAVIPEQSARAILINLAMQDVSMGGLWRAEAAAWQRFDRPWNGADRGRGSAELLGTIQIIYGTPTRHEITVFRASITRPGQALDFTVTTLCDEALGFGGLTLATCPRANLRPPPQPFRFNN
jgi:hypothetical protein